MQAKIEEKEKAIELRKAGETVPNIANILNISKSSASLYVRGVPIPERLTKKYRDKIRKERLEAKNEAKESRRKKREEKRAKELDSKGRVRLKDKIITGSGYYFIRAPEGYKGKKYIKNKYVMEHRFLMEQKLGRLLRSDEIVHHKDHNKLNNDIDNLELTNILEHNREHAPEPEMVGLNCSYCGDSFLRRKYRHKKEQVNNFCCRSHQASYQQKYQVKRSKKTLK